MVALCVHTGESCSSRLCMHAQVDFSYEPTVSARGTAAVVDGRRLMLTPLRLSVLPPPLCSVQALLPAPISHVAFCDHGSCEVITFSTSYLDTT